MTCTLRLGLTGMTVVSFQGKVREMRRLISLFSAPGHGGITMSVMSFSGDFSTWFN